MRKSLPEPGRSQMGKNELLFVIATTVFGAGLLVSGEPFWIALIAAVTMFSLLWLISLPLKNASIVDIFWGLGFITLAWFFVATAPTQLTLRAYLVLAMVTIWGLRLSWHIGARNIGHGEDFRYQAWRDAAPQSFWWISYFKVFLLQAVVLWIVATPLLLAIRGSTNLNLLDLIGLILWLFGFTFESIADWQLRRFKQAPANQGLIMRSGLWSLSRHPNYFGESVLWLGFALIGMSAGGALALISPVLLTFLLIKISGVAMLDRAMVERRPAYAEYLKSTPAFFPWPWV